MGKKKHQKNKFVFFTKKYRRILGLLFFLLFCFCVYLIPKSYYKNYTIDTVYVQESFDLSKNLFTFTFSKGEDEFTYAFSHSYFLKRKLIQGVSIYEQEDTICLKPSSLKIEIPYLCKKNHEPIFYQDLDASFKENLSDVSETLEKREYDKFTYTFSYDATYVAWNYKDILIFDTKGVTSISLFNKDFYELPIVGQVGEYLLIPDYEDNYYFQKIYVIDIKKKKKVIWNLSEKISFDSYVLGAYKNSIYFVDKKEKIEWKLTPKSKKMEKIGTLNKEGKIYNKGWEDISLVKLSSEKQTFIFDEPLQYFVKDNCLVYSFLQEETPLNISLNQIVSVKDEQVYYLRGDTLYSFDPFLGERFAMQYSEWNFHQNHMIFIF